MRRGLDGAPDRSSYDDAVASLCRSKDTSKDLDGRLVPTFVQTTASSVTVTFPPPVADYGATYLTDQDGTIVGFGQASSAADSLALDFDGSPLRLTLHVHLTGACRTVRSAPMSTWRTVLEEWEYMSGGGVTPNSSRWDEPTLQKSAPTLQLLPSDGPTRRARVTMLQQPDLPVPLLFVACSSSSNEPLLLHIFGPVAGTAAAAAPAAAPAAATAAATAPAAGHEDTNGRMGGGPSWWVDSAANFTAEMAVPHTCHSLRACGSMPDGMKAGCGGPGPRRCTKIDLLPPLVAELEARHPVEPRAAQGMLERQTREGLVLRYTAECQAAAAAASRAGSRSAPPILYARSTAGKLLAFAEGKGRLNVALPFGYREAGQRAEVVGFQFCAGTLSSARFDIAALPPPPPPAAAAAVLVAPLLIAPLTRTAPPPPPPPPAASLLTGLQSTMTVGACIGVVVAGLLVLGACLGLWLSCRPWRRRGSAVQVDAQQEKREETQALRGAEDAESATGAFGGVCAAAP